MHVCMYVSKICVCVYGCMYSCMYVYVWLDVYMHTKHIRHECTDNDVPVGHPMKDNPRTVSRRECTGRSVSKRSIPEQSSIHRLSCAVSSASSDSLYCSTTASCTSRTDWTRVTSRRSKLVLQVSYHRHINHTQPAIQCTKHRELACSQVSPVYLTREPNHQQGKNKANCNNQRRATRTK